MKSVYIYISFLCLCLLSRVTVNGQILWKISLDEWAEKEFANPEKMAKAELASKAFQIVDYNFQGEPADKLLQTIAKELPELNSYLEWHTNQKPDSLFLINRNALNTLTDYLGKLDSNSDNYLYARYRTLINESNVSKNLEKWDALIDELEKKLKINNTAERRALLSLAKIARHNNDLNFRVLMNDKDYENIPLLEEEALKAYPLDSEEETLLRAELYNALGNLKYSFQDEMTAWIMNGEDAQNFKPYSELVGFTRSYPSNAKDYLRRAKEIGLKFLSEGHPLIINFDVDLHIYDKNMRGLRPETFENLNKDYQYSEYYYPQGWFDTNLNKLMGALDGYNAAYSQDSNSIADYLNVIRTYLGHTNPLYLALLQSVAFTLINNNNDAGYWQQRIIDDYAKAGISSDSNEFNYNLLNLYFNLLNNPETTSVADIHQKVREIGATYKKNHDQTDFSFALGNTLGHIYYMHLYDGKGGSEFMDIVLGDIEKKYGKEARKQSVWWKNFIEKANLNSNDLSDKEIEKTYKELIKTVKNLDIPYKDKHLWKIIISYNNYFTNISKNPDLNKALDMMLEYGDLGKRILPYGEFAIESMIGYLLNSTGRNPENSVVYTDRAMEIADSAFRQGDHLRLRYEDFDWPINSYIDIGEFEKALKASDMQSEVYEKELGNEFSLDYFYQNIQKAKLLNALNRKTEASRLLAECIHQLKSMPAFGTGTYLLDCLWEDYYLTQTGSLEDFPMAMAKLWDIAIKTTELKSLNPDNDILYGYLVRALAEYLNIFSTAKKFFNSMEGEEEYNVFTESEQFKDNTSKMNEMFALSVEVFEDYPTQNPQYISDPNYLNLALAIANFYQNDNQTDKALAMYDKALKLPMNDYTKSGILLRLIAIARDENNIASFNKYFTEYEKLMNSIEYWTDNDKMLLANHGVYYNTMKGDYEKALKYARDYYNTSRHILDNNFRLMTTAEQTSFMDSYGDPAIFLCYVIELEPDNNTAEIYDAVVYRTGMQLRSQRSTLEAIRKSQDPEVKNLVDSIEKLSKKIIPLYKTGEGNSSPDATQNNIEEMKRNMELQRQINYMEGKLLDLVDGLRQKDIPDVTWKEIQSRLKPGEAAIEFVYSNKNVYALIVKPGYDSPKAVKLTGQDELYNLLKSQRKKSSAALAKNLYSKYAGKLYEMLWKPMENELQGVENVYYTAPGILNNLAFNSFQDSEGKYLFDRFNMHQLSTTGQIVFDEDYSTPQSMVVMGNILYGKDQMPADKKTAEQRGIEDDFDLTDESDTRGVSRDYFRHLPFTVEEINNISALFNEINVDKEELHEATESKLREMVKSHPDILHLATHGFYINSDTDAAKVAFYKEKDKGSMMRSGIALSGAEEAWRGTTTEPDSNDGIMTAQEVSMLDLKGTTLVTMSACETALGAYNYEGIYGLQRGFKQAGVKSMLLSLWSVNDESTAIFMQNFYKGIKAGMSKQQAWKEAVGKVKELYPDPYYWASFILIDP